MHIYPLGLVFVIILIAPLSNLIALVFTKTAGFRHQSIPECRWWQLKMMGRSSIQRSYPEVLKFFLRKGLAKNETCWILVRLQGLFSSEAQELASIFEICRSGKGVGRSANAAPQTRSTSGHGIIKWWGRISWRIHSANLKIEVVDQNHPAHLAPSKKLDVDRRTLWVHMDIQPNLKGFDHRPMKALTQSSKR